METLVIALVLTVAGAYLTARNIRFMRDDQALRQYMQTSPKAVLWVRKYGLDGATQLARKTFLPIGTLASLAMFGIGVWMFWRMYG